LRLLKLDFVKEKFLGLFLFFCLAAPFITGYTWLHHQKYVLRKSIKKQIIAGVNKEELVLIQLSKEQAKKELKWKHSKEFEYHHEMYDIVTFEETADSVFYRCWWDHEETKLNRRLQHLLALTMGQHHQKNKQQKRLASYFKSFYTPNNSISNNWYSISTSVKYYTYNETFQSVSIAPPFPPPKPMA
tara:strand:- start:5646 stop:6206 length:561 start_codon:yes stop_codon:yes gene_type:complete